ncbi:hypothetical protein OPT61_g2572 [Boeremia exigua]|uniref:Uncharacterized protein n=1 Tax=Boeremia exigua TaxID=749465 RepID=A0ACC2IL26_9PLEO|nr:hypothetical protein OPT61_g2572 [Boeremia exigua]
MVFRRRTTPVQPPVPAFDIRLDGQPNQIYTPGDPIQGHVLLTPVQKMDTGSITVSLLGRSTVSFYVYVTLTTGGYAITAIDKAPLLDLTKEVVKNSELVCLEPGHTYEFPFSFSFPVKTPNSRDGYRDTDDDRWTSRPHVLLPTFWAPIRASAFTKKTFSYNFSRIDYGIKATLVCPETGIVQDKKLRNLTASTPVLFTSNNPKTPTPQPKTLSKQTKNFKIRYLDSVNEEQYVAGTSRRLLTRFSSSAQKLPFEVSIEMPEVVKAGSDLRFRSSSVQSSQATYRPTMQIECRNCLWRV